jgi:hypothetical protein
MPSSSSSLPSHILHATPEAASGVSVAVKVVRLMDAEGGAYSSRSLDALKQEIQVRWCPLC